MCTLVEDYAKEREREGKIQEAVESSIEYDRPREETITRLVKKFGLAEEKAQEYYDIFAK